MADFVSHGLVGAGLMAAPAAHCRPGIKIALAGYGFVLGAWPDAGDWIAAKLGIRPRWELYTYYHTTNDWWWLMHPPFYVHTKFIDPIFHLIPGWSWWPVLWPVWSFHLLFAIELLRIAFWGIV